MALTRTLIATTVIAFSLALSAAVAQTPGTSPTVPSRPAINQTTPPDDIRSPMQEEAKVPNMAPVTTVCGPHNAVTMKDEYGRQYNCRGDRVR